LNALTMHCSHLPLMFYFYSNFFFSSRRRHTRFSRDWSSDVCSSDLEDVRIVRAVIAAGGGEEQRGGQREGLRGRGARGGQEGSHGLDSCEEHEVDCSACIRVTRDDVPSPTRVHVSPVASRPYIVTTVSHVVMPCPSTAAA